MNEATEERLEFPSAPRKELRPMGIHDAVDSRFDDLSSVGEGGGASFSASPMKGANGRGNLPSAS